MSLDQPRRFVKHQTPTRDAFLGGRLIVSQPAQGFRAGLDSVLLGAAVAKESESLLDLGAGVGTAALVALAHNPSLCAMLAEQDEEALALARSNVEANGFATRASVICADVAAKGAEREAAGLRREAYRSVIANPPFFDRDKGTLAPHAGRAGARHMADAALEAWVRTAAASAAPGGEVIFIHTIESLPALLASFDRRFGAICVLPLCPREAENVSRILIRGIKGSRAPLQMLASRALHLSEGRGFVPQFEAIFRGTARLIW